MDEKETKKFESDKVFINELREIILSNLDNPNFSLQFLCRATKLSRSQLFRKIKQGTGLSSSLFIRKVKLEKASVLLLQSELNISEIAYSTGFASPQNFSKYFTKEYGISPSEFKRQKALELKDQLHNDQKNQEDRETEQIENRIKGKSPVPKYYLYAILVIGILSIYFLIRFIIQDFNTPAKEDKPTIEIFENSIAVLPFANFGDDETLLFCEGIMDDILTSLSQYGNLKVISRTSAMQYRDTKKTINTIAEELKVAFILEGSVRREGDQLRVTAQLIRARDDFHVWAKNFTARPEEIFTLQSELSIEITNALNQKISDENKSGGTSLSSNLAAYNEYVIGRKLLMIRTKPALLEAVLRFDAALKLDETFDLALAQKACAYNLLSNLGYEDKRTYTNKAQEFALKAIQMNPQNSLAYATMGLSYNDLFKWEQAKTSFEIALNYTPNDALTNYWFSLLLRETGHIEKAIERSTKANELDPLYPVIYGGHVLNCILGGRKDLVVEALSDGHNLFGDSFIYYWVNAKYQESIQNYDSAIYFFQKTLEFNPNLLTVESSIAFCRGRLGQTAEVLDFIKSHDRPDEGDYISVLMSYCGLKDVENAIRYLKLLASINAIPKDFLLDRKYDVIRHRSEYKEVLKKFGLTIP